MEDLGLLALRAVIGLLFIGHAAQKLLGWFGGEGVSGTADWLRSLGLRPALFWAVVGGLTELGGGTLVALGLLGPLGSLAIIATMLVAITTVHWSNGLWVDQGGFELPLTNIAIAVLLAFVGPGAYALDPLLGIALPMPVTFLGGLVLVIGGVGVTLATRASPAPAVEPAGQGSAS